MKSMKGRLHAPVLFQNKNFIYYRKAALRARASTHNVLLVLSKDICILSVWFGRTVSFQNQLKLKIYKGIRCLYKYLKEWNAAESVRSRGSSAKHVCVCVCVFRSFTNTFILFAPNKTWVKFFLYLFLSPPLSLSLSLALFLFLFTSRNLFKIQVYFETEFFQWLSSRRSGGRKQYCSFFLLIKNIVKYFIG